MTEKEKIGNIVKFLENLYLINDEIKVIKNIRLLSKEYGLSDYTIMAISRLKIVEMVKKGSYVWKSSTEPNSIMAMEVLSEIRKIQNDYNKSTCKNSVKANIPHKFTSVDQIKAEAKKEGMLEARKLLIDASQLAKTLGKDITVMSPENFIKFMEISEELKAIK
jgi:hypothetical protein